MLGTPPVVFADLELWAVGYLRTFLAARPASETFADNVKVATKNPEKIPARLVTIRDDGGQRRATVNKTASFGVNVYAETAKVCSDLARIVAAAFEAAPGSGPVVAHVATSGPYPVGEDSEKPHRYLGVDLLVRGVGL